MKNCNETPKRQIRKSYQSIDIERFITEFRIYYFWDRLIKGHFGNQNLTPVEI